MNKQMDPIKVCFIAKTAYSLFNSSIVDIPGATHGGAEVDLYLLAQELIKDGRYEVSFIVGDYGQEEIEEYGGIKVYKCFVNFHARGFSNRPNRKIEREKRITNFINNLQRFSILQSIFLLFILQNKIIHFSNMRKLALLFKKIDADIYFQEAAGSLTGFCCFLAKVFRKKFVYRTAHDNDCNGVFIAEFLRAGRIDAHLYKWGLKNADALITQNRHNQLSLLGTHNLNSVVIKNAYEIPREIHEDKSVVLWVARSVFWKQPFMFLELAKKNIDLDFIMICPPANEEGVDFQKLLDEASQISNLVFHKHVPFGEIDSYFKKAKIFVNTSLYEGYPNTFVQATKNGTPVLSLHSNPDNFLENYECGLCTNGDFELLNRELGRMINDHEIYKIRSKNAYKYAMENHDLKSITEQYKKVFEDLLFPAR